MMLMPRIFNDDLWNDFFWDYAVPSGSANRCAEPEKTKMKTDVVESKDGFCLTVELPGYKKEDVKAQLKDGYLTISAESSREKEEKDEKGKFIRRERYTGKNSRTFYVGDAVSEEDIKAKFEDGILTVEVPKKQPAPKVEEQKYINIA